MSVPISEPVPQRIIPPPEFPVTWQNPNDECLYWTRDRMHDPGQAKPLQEAVSSGCADGLNLALAHYGISDFIRMRLINTYIYGANGSPPTPPDAAADAKEKILTAMRHLRILWDETWLPEIQKHLTFWEKFPLGSATMPDLIAHLDETQARYRRLWEVHFHIVILVYNAMSFFDDLYQDLFGKENPFGAYALLEGFPNKTVEMGQSLWRLSRRAAADPAVRAAVEQDTGSAVLDQLQQSPAGCIFLADLQAFLQEYGKRSELWGVAFPSWREDPTPVMRNLRDYLAQPDRDLEQDLALAAHRREDRIAQVRAALQGYPQRVVEQFEFLLQAAQVGLVLSEDHNFWIDFAGDYAVRQVLREFGRRLALAGVIKQTDDVFYLRLDELRATAAELPHPDRKGLVAARKAEEARFAGVEPPPALGTPPADAPPADDPLARANEKFFGAPVQPSLTPGQFVGLAGSPGTVRGRAKVVHNLAEAGKLQSGDILVAVTTAPPWTPLFATAAAVVIDTGGVLSHCAVVAREYGIPAVVGTNNASGVIKDGDMLEVDGLAGIVRIVDASQVLPIEIGSAEISNAGPDHD